jgi:hypothetical protein
MGYVTTFTATGQGTLSLGGLQDVNEIAARVVTLANEARTYGTSPVRRVFQQAWYGLAVTPGAGPLAGYVLVTFQKHLELECETTVLNSFGHLPGDTLYYDVYPGGVMYFEVDWP